MEKGVRGARGEGIPHGDMGKEPDSEVTGERGELAATHPVFLGAMGVWGHIDWRVKGLSAGWLLRDSPERHRAGINNRSIGALFVLRARSKRTLVSAYQGASTESRRNAAPGKCAGSHDDVD